MVRTPIPRLHILSSIVRLFLRFPSAPRGSSALHPKRNRDRSESGHSSLATHPDCLGSESATLYCKLTGYTASLALISTRRLKGGAWFAVSRRPTPSAALPSHFNTPTEAQKHVILAPGGTLQFLRGRLSRLVCTLHTSGYCCLQ